MYLYPSLLYSKTKIISTFEALHYTSLWLLQYEKYNAYTNIIVSDW